MFSLMAFLECVTKNVKLVDKFERLFENVMQNKTPASNQKSRSTFSS